MPPRIRRWSMRATQTRFTVTAGALIFSDRGQVLLLKHRFRAGSGWGMLYMVAAIYKVTGRNMLAVQYINSVLGAATAPIAYVISKEIFPNTRVARVCALLSAFFPSLENTPISPFYSKLFQSREFRHGSHTY